MRSRRLPSEALRVRPEGSTGGRAELRRPASITRSRDMPGYELLAPQRSAAPGSADLQHSWRIRAARQQFRRLTEQALLNDLDSLSTGKFSTNQTRLTTALFVALSQLAQDRSLEKPGTPEIYRMIVGVSLPSHYSGSAGSFA